MGPVPRRWYAPLRFPAHGLQMLAAYIGQLAPASRITNCATSRRARDAPLQRIAYRTAQLSSHRTGLDIAATGGAGRTPTPSSPSGADRAGFGDPDWGGVCRHERRDQAPPRSAGQRRAGGSRGGAMRSDTAQRSLLACEDAVWHSAWTAALLPRRHRDTPANAERVSGWLDVWRPGRKLPLPPWRASPARRRSLSTRWHCRAGDRRRAGYAAEAIGV